MIYLTVNDIKQFVYCRRIVFYNNVMPVEKKSTYKMEHGRKMEDEIERLDSRRKLTKYRLNEGRRLFHHRLSSSALGLSGTLDLLIISPEGYFPVDYKYTEGKPHDNHIYQLTGYALLIEGHYDCEVNEGFVFLIPQEDVVIFTITDELKARTKGMLEEARLMIGRESMPDATEHRNRCFDCEYRNYCGDVF